LRSGQSRARLVIVGGGPLDAHLRELAERLGVSDTVLFLGERGDARELLGGFDLYCLPSLSEGTSIGLLEAMAASLPVVATRVGGTPAVVGQHASLFEPGDEDGLLARLFAAVRSPEWRASTGALLRSRAEASYSLQVSASSYLRVYQQGIQSSGT
jgi:glycosyltransferase involved in cell wall biosynthesis